jgi:hypothetical protein
MSQVDDLEGVVSNPTHCYWSRLYTVRKPYMCLQRRSPNSIHYIANGSMTVTYELGRILEEPAVTYFNTFRAKNEISRL